jgi:hypothetical protein
MSVLPCIYQGSKRSHVDTNYFSIFMPECFMEEAPVGRENIMG